MKAILSPSLLSANFANLALEISLLEKAGITWMHLDIMDGNFVPNITFGAPVIKCLRPLANLFFDVHLMVAEPDRYLEDFAQAGADLLVAHLETLKHGQRCLQKIHDLGLKAGLAFNPGTDFKLCRWLLPYADMILLMGVNPGFSGQKFIPETLAKVEKCRKFLDDLGHENMPIQVDGGVNLHNAADLAQAGADILVSGSSFFGNKDYIKASGDFDSALNSGKFSGLLSRPSFSTAASWKRAAN